MRADRTASYKILFDKPFENHGIVVIVIVTALEADGNATVDDIKRPMAPDLAGIGPDFLSKLISVGMGGVEDLGTGRRGGRAVPRRDFEIADGDPNGVNVAARGEFVRDAFQTL